MSSVYGPIALTPGTMASQNIDASAAWIHIENDSLTIDLGISFQPNSPGPVTQFGGTNAWAGVVRAGGGKTFQAPAWPDFTGVVWLFPLSVATSSAVTGTFSSYSRAYVTTGYANEQPPDGMPIVRGLDITSQPRIINIPMTPFGCYTTGIIAVSGGNLYQPFPATWAVTNPSFDTGCVCYLYYASFSPTNTAGRITFEIRAVVRDFNTPATILAQIPVVEGAIGLGAGAGTGEQWTHNASVPFHLAILRSTYPTMGIVEIGFFVVFSTAVFPLGANFMIDSDKQSPGQVSVPGIGQGLNPTAFVGGVPKF